MIEHSCFDCGEACDCDGTGGDSCVGCQQCEEKTAQEEKQVAKISGKTPSLAPDK